MSHTRHVTVAAAVGCGLLMSSCATGPNKTSVYYSPPSVAPVQQKITAAQSSVTNAQTHAAKAKTAVATALRAVESEKDKSPELKLALDDANTEIDALTTELTLTQAALQDATDNSSALQGRINEQTGTLNTCIDDKNTAITQRDTAQAQVKVEQAHVHKLKFWICALAAELAAFLVFRFKWVFALAGPWGFIAGIVGAPVAVFWGLWAIL